MDYCKNELWPAPKSGRGTQILIIDKAQNESWQMIIFLILPFLTFTTVHYVLLTLCSLFSVSGSFSLVTLILPCIGKPPILNYPLNWGTLNFNCGSNYNHLIKQSTHFHSLQVTTYPRLTVKKSQNK